MTTLAWHFVGKTLRDGRPVPKDGKWLTHKGEVVICAAGLHASERIIDALQFAPGSTICRVECDGIVDRGYDKLVCRKRKIIWRVDDADDLLRAFARKAALSVIDLWDAPEVVRKYLETGDESLRAAARVAARDAVWDAARDAARDAAWAAAWDAARVAARDAARAAAWAAAWVAARDAAWDAARAAAWDAARDAARAAARAAKIADFNTQLEAMVIAHHDKLAEAA